MADLVLLTDAEITAVAGSLIHAAMVREPIAPIIVAVRQIRVFTALNAIHCG